MDDKKIIKFYLDNGILLSPELLKELNSVVLPLRSEFSVISKDVISIAEKNIPVNVDDFEKSVVLKEKYKNFKVYQKFLEFIDNKNSVTSAPLSNNTARNLSTHSQQDSETISNSKIEPDMKENSEVKSGEKTINTELLLKERAGHNLEYTSEEYFDKSSNHKEENASSNVKSVDKEHREMSDEELENFKKDFMIKNKIKLALDYSEKSHKRTVADFVNYFNSRYKELEKILRVRQELQSLTSIARINAKKERENVAVIGYVYEKAITKNNNIMLTIEDQTGFVKAVVRQNKEDLYRLAQEIQLDEVVGITGTHDGVIFVSNILLPDVPLTKELKKSPQEGYFVVIADPQVGSKVFLEKEFKKFLYWINGQVGSDVQKELASKIKYLFIVGDLVDGVGIYPDQEYDLNIIDVKDQYEMFAEYIRQVPSHIPIILCPGNHDVGRISEPQPRLHDEYTRPVWAIPNVLSVSNPSIINIDAQPEQGFDGFDVLLYHGFSFIYYSYNVPSIRSKGPLRRPDLIMKYLLQRRHLAPTHASSLYIPDPKRDYLTIDKIPDFFLSGHIHRSSVNNYKNVTCINASCWMATTDEQERRGLENQPARAFIINMQTREIKVMNFLSKEDQEKENKDAEVLVEN